MTLRDFAAPVLCLVCAAAASASVSAQQVTRSQIPGISTFAQIESTIACGGATTPAAIREIRKMGFKAVVNVRLASEPGALVEEEGVMAREAGLRYIHLPFDANAPDPHLIDNFIAAVTARENIPVYVHCAAGGRAAALWMVKRVKGDQWPVQRALEEANGLGLNDRFRPWVLNYLRTHP